MPPSVLRCVLSGCLLLAASAVPVLAQPAASVPQPAAGDPQTADGVLRLGRVDVTVQADAPPPGVTVLGEEDIRVLDRSSFANLFTLVPGITASKVGPRNEDTIYLRGFDLRQTPLYVDGIPVYVPYDGYVDLARFLSADVGEVRVSRGLTSNLYGPNTLGGAINVVSRRPSAPFEAIGAITYGSGETWDGSAQLGTQHNGWYLTGGASLLRRDTYPLANGFVPVASQPAGDRLNAYAEDYKVNASVGYLTPRGSEYVLRVVSQRGEKGNPVYAGSDPVVRPRFWQWPYWDKDSVYGLANFMLGQPAWLKARVYYDSFKNSLYAFDDAAFATQARPSSFRSRYDDYTVGTTLEAGSNLSSRVTLRGVAHWKSDIHREANDGEPQRRVEDRLLSGGTELTVALRPNLSLVAGVSVDNQDARQAQDYQGGVISDFPTASATGVNPQLTMYYSVADGARLHAGVSRKTRLPTIKDRYSYRMGQAIPNPALEAERATSVEAGYERPLTKQLLASVTGFYIDVDDLVQQVYLQPNLFQLQNVGQVAHTGLDLDLRGHWTSRVETGVSYNYLHRQSKSTPAVPLLNVPGHKFLASAIVAPVARLQLAAILTVESERQVQNDGGTLLRMASYGTVDIKGSWRLAPATSVEAGVRNLLDKNYVLADGYPQPGRVLYAGARIGIGR